MPLHRWIACLLFATAWAWCGSAEAKSYPALFGAKEIGSTNWKFNKGIVVDWKGMLVRWKNGAPCETQICTAKSWSGLVEQVRAAGAPMAQIKAANSLMNQHKYIEDINNWSKSEYWASSYEFMKKN